jgi:hypothetical protein
MAKKTKPVSSGIDLTGLTTAQLQALAVEAKTKAAEQSEKETKAAVKALKASGELDSFKKEFLALGAEGKKLTRKSSFELVLPVRFTMTPGGPNLGIDDYTNIFDYDEDLSEDDLFFYSFTAKLSKDHNLTKKQAAALNGVIEDYAKNACDDIFDVIPEELMTHYIAYAKKVSAFVQKAKEAGLSLKELAIGKAS